MGKILKTNRQTRHVKCRHTKCRLLVLIPHRDTRLLLRKWSDSLFKAGFFGAYHFPWVAPLARLCRPFNTEELKHCARIIRQETLRYNNGKINASEALRMAFPVDERPQSNELSLFGPCLNLTFPANALMPSAQDKIIKHFSSPLIGACVLQPAEDIPESKTMPQLPQISFRAAAVANMNWYIDPPPYTPASFSGRWKIGKPSWLASVRK